MVLYIEALCRVYTNLNWQILQTQTQYIYIYIYTPPFSRSMTYDTLLLRVNEYVKVYVCGVCVLMVSSDGVASYLL